MGNLTIEKEVVRKLSSLLSKIDCNDSSSLNTKRFSVM